MTNDSAGRLARAVAVTTAVLTTVTLGCATPPTGPPTTTSAPTTTSSSTTTTTTPTTPAGTFPGDVPEGYVRWGAAVSGNSDPAPRHESARSMGLHRTYFAWNNATGMTAMAADDLAHKRLPWVSIKTPAQAGPSDPTPLIKECLWAKWDDVARGDFDADLTAMVQSLGGLDGPVWLTVFHEPENDVPDERVFTRDCPDNDDGSLDDTQAEVIASWRAMQQHVRQVIDANNVDNVALAPVLMTWTFDARSARTPSDWWVADTFDFAGLDHYASSVAGSMLTDAAGQPRPAWTAARSFYRDLNIDIALGEWGNCGADAAAAAEMTDFYQAAVTSTAPSQILGMAYFDSSLNVTNSPCADATEPLQPYVLEGEALVRFNELVGDSRSILADQ